MAQGNVITKVSPHGEQWRLNGEKFYSTGSLFSDWMDVYAQRSDTGGDVIAAVRTRQPGIVQTDDWDGFGQRTTGSGTSRFIDAEVDAENIIDFATRFKYQTAFYQLVLLATLSGIGRSTAPSRRSYGKSATAPTANSEPAPCRSCRRLRSFDR